MKTINFGILSTSEICPRSLLDPAKTNVNVNILGIASRDINKAKAFASKHDIPYSFGSYDDLLKCDEINAVYIPLITSLHVEWTIKTIEAGKHVLVEKPICLSSQECIAIQNAINKNKSVTVCEGLMAQHHPWFQAMKDIIESEKYGKLKSIRTRACYNLEDKNDFRLYPEKGGSVFFEEGLLWCHVTQYFLGLNTIEIKGNCEFNGPFGGDHIFTANMEFPNNVTSSLYCSYNDPYEANHWFEFEEAELFIRNFWRPTFGHVKLKITIRKNDGSDVEPIIFPAQNYFHNQLDYFVNTDNDASKNGERDYTFERIRIMEEIYNSAKDF